MRNRCGEQRRSLILTSRRDREFHKSIIAETNRARDLHASCQIAVRIKLPSITYDRQVAGVLGVDLSIAPHLEHHQ